MMVIECSSFLAEQRTMPLDLCVILQQNMIPVRSRHLLISCQDKKMYSIRQQATAQEYMFVTDHYLHSNHYTK